MFTLYSYSGDLVCSASGCSSSKLITPIKLPCGHTICPQCLKHFAARCTAKGCNKEIPQDFAAQDRTQLVNQDALARLKSFQLRCNRFVSELVSKFTFSVIYDAGTSQPFYQYFF